MQITPDGESSDGFENALSTYFATPNCTKNENAPSPNTYPRPQKAPRNFTEADILSSAAERLGEKKKKLEKKRAKWNDRLKELDYLLNQENPHRREQDFLAQFVRYRNNLKEHRERVESKAEYHIEAPDIVNDTLAEHCMVPIPLERIINVNYTKAMSLLASNDIIVYTNDKNGYYCVVFSDSDDQLITYYVIKKSCLI